MNHTTHSCLQGCTAVIGAARRAVCTVLAATALATGLSACAPLIVGGAVVGGVMAVDRRTAGTQIEDEGIELRAAARIREALGDRVHVNITSYNRQALLTGEVSNAQDRQAVEQIVSRVDNVRSVVNDLAVMAPSTLGQRSNDTFITGKVRASLVDARDLSANAFKVVTERNIVYLMGRVSQREAARATEVTRGVSGVAKVVRVFEIISEEELRRIATQPPPVTTDSAPTRAP
jgi:osmotically-inducible protein OsmY